jgi:hypothetical protein
MSTIAITFVPKPNAILADVVDIPWRGLAVRIQGELQKRTYFVAGAEELGVLWRGERINAPERRRRITVFAAQHHWKVETRADGASARFHRATPSGLIARETLSRNHE